MFFLISKNVNSERLIALMPTLVRWWEWIRANLVAGVEVKEEKGGGTPLKVPMVGRKGWREETLLEIEMYGIKANELDGGAATLVVDFLQLLFGRGRLESCPDIMPFSVSSANVLRILCGYFEHQRRVQF